jgi:hypothetical protein
VNYAPLTVVTPRAPLTLQSRPEIAAEVRGNVCFERRTGHASAVDAALANATHSYVVADVGSLSRA